MKEMIIKLLSEVGGSVEVRNPRFSTIGSHIDALVALPAPECEIAFNATFERSEIVAQLYRDGLIVGQDTNTNQMFTINDDGKKTAQSLLHVYNDLSESFKDVFHDDLLYSALQSALTILDAEEDAVELFLRYFHEYNLMEKQALLWRLSELASIHDYHTSQVVQHILNYMDGTLPTMPNTLDVRYRLFALWMKKNHGSLYGLCRAMQPNETANNYTTNIA